MIISFIFVSPAFAQNIDITEIISWFSRISDAEGRFYEQHPNGQTKSGKIYVSFPGKLRLNYDYPDGKEVIIDGSFIALFQNSQQNDPLLIRLRDHPLRHILYGAQHIVEGDVIFGARRKNGVVQVILSNPGAPDLARVAANFSEKPTRLLGWTVRLIGGKPLKVILRNMNWNADIDQKVFDIWIEMNSRIRTRAR